MVVAVCDHSDVHMTVFYQEQKIISLHKKWSLLLRIFSVNVTKSAGNCGFGDIYWRNP